MYLKIFNKVFNEMTVITHEGHLRNYIFSSSLTMRPSIRDGCVTALLVTWAEKVSLLHHPSETKRVLSKQTSSWSRERNRMTK